MASIPRFLSTTLKSKTLSIENVNPNLKIMEYAVRGPLVIRAGEIEKELLNGVQKPFKEVIYANIGDCHAMGQRPITFFRQILALINYPPLLEEHRFPSDVKERAVKILKSCRGGSVGSYSEASGIEEIRKDVARFIEKRDGHPVNWMNIFLCAGASDGIRKLLKLFVTDVNEKKAGVLIPIPQYPLYSASLAELGLAEINYFLDEERNWQLNIEDLKQAVDKARHNCNPKAVVVINPGNPTGQVLPRKNIEEIIKFAYDEALVILADEVYQDNIYDEGCQFHSVKKILCEMGEPYKSGVELASFMSCSKGYMGECGIRGGYTEIINLCPEVLKLYKKANTAMLCPTILGQACIGAVVNPPQRNEPSYESFMEEKQAVLNSLKIKADMVVEAFNSFTGFKCNDIQGAMYAFPRIELPEKAIKAADTCHRPPDVFYAFELLENCGICVVPGTGFGQKPGTYHFRTTILAPIDKVKTMLEKMNEFHKEFIRRYN